MKTEKEITKAIRSMLTRLSGVYTWKQWQGPMSNPKGVSDIVGSLKRQFNLCSSNRECPNKKRCQLGQFIAIEIKKEGWEPPNPSNIKAFRHYQEQLKFINRIKNTAGIGLFAMSVEDVINGLGIEDRFII